MIEEMRFEEALSRLESIVEKLESGELSLEESLAAFEEGIRLSRICSKQLEEAERKIEILIKGEDGQMRIDTLTQDMEDDNDEA